MKRNTATKWPLPPFTCERCGIPSYGYCMRCFQVVAQFAEQEQAMKRIRVPDGMLSAGRAVYSGYVTAQEGARRILEAALLWLSENPQVPTDEQWSQLFSDYADAPHGYPPIESRLRWTLDQWQRRCFVQEEPEIPAEIEDLLHGKETDTYINWPVSEVDERIVEAFRRGLRKGQTIEYSYKYKQPSDSDKCDDGIDIYRQGEQK